MSRILKLAVVLMAILCLATSCNLPRSPEASPAPTKDPTQTLIPPTMMPTETPVPLLLDEVPLVWFAPLPPLPVVAGRNFAGSTDFMELFQPNANWNTAATHIQVFKL